jgi:chemotaxis receptor (MCP) glutamine deamidase CheD
MQETVVLPMRCAFATGGLLTIRNIAAGLGVFIYSPASKCAAGLHVLRACARDESVQDPLYCVSTAIPHVLAKFREKNIQPPYSIAIAGGGSMLPVNRGDVGAKIVEAAREAFQRAGLPIKKEDTGGARVRSMILNVTEGKLKIESRQ